jgi:hypothetical protein
VLNVIVSELTALERFLESTEGGDARADRAARVSRLRGADRLTPEGEQEGAEMGADMRAVAPPIQSFASGRRR